MTEQPPGPFHQGPHGQPRNPAPPAQPGAPNSGNHPQWGQAHPPAPQQYGQHVPPVPQHVHAYPQPQPGTYGGLGAFEKKPNNRKKLILGSFIGIVILVAVAVGILWATGALGSSTLDHVAVERGVARVLKSSYGEQGAKRVSCPDNVEAKNGSKFTCRLTLNGQPKTVAVTVTDDSNDYEIGAPK